MKTFVYLSAILMSTVFWACKNTPADDSASEINTTDTLITVQSGYFNLTFMLPKTDARLGQLEHGYDEEFGELQIRMGEGFALFVTEEKPVMADIKADLENDMFFKNKFIQESPTFLHFQRNFPDGSEGFHAYYEVRNIGGTDYLFRTEEMGEFTATDIDLIKKTISTFAPIQKGV